MSSSEKNDFISREDWIKLLDENDLGRSNMNKLIMNYLVTGSEKLDFFLVYSLKLYHFAISEGFKEAAEKFQQESGVMPTVDLYSLDDRIRIRDAIMSGRIQEATAVINQLHPELLDNDRYLYFHLQVSLFMNLLFKN